MLQDLSPVNVRSRIWEYLCTSHQTTSCCTQREATYSLPRVTNERT